MIPTIEMIVQGLITQGYKNFGGSDVFRILINEKTSQKIKVFYDDYDFPANIIIRESVDGYNE